MSVTIPWYKQFWPWALIAVPLISIALSLNMLRLALDTTDSLVIDDYYKEGKSINTNLALYKQAVSFGIQVRLELDGTQLTLTPLTPFPDPSIALTIDFFHPTLQQKDVALKLLADGKGVYRAELPSVMQGKWRISLHPLNERWKLKEVVFLNPNSRIDLIAK